MYSAILSQIKTVDDRQRLREEIEILLESFYEVEEGKFDEALINKVRGKIASAISEEINKGELDKGKYLEGLREDVDKLKTVKLTLGFEPTRVSIDKFWQYFAGSSGQNIILDVEYLPKVIGGAIIVYEGEYLDFSLKALLDAELTESAKEVLGDVPEKKRQKREVN